MKPLRSSVTSTASLATFLAMLVSTACWAGPAEDYAEGAKQYQEGDLTGALPALRRAADAGHAAAQAVIGEILDKADFNDEAIAYFRKSAAQGNADGQFGLGTMLSVGEGAPKNLSEARKWIKLAAEQGHKAAINDMASAYITGGLDIPENERQSTEGLRWIRAAADNGYLTAMEKLSDAYRKGEMGLSIDIKTADLWAEKIRKIRNIPQKGRRAKKE